MFEHETCEWLTDDQADVQRETGVRAGGAARAFQRDDVIGVAQHDVARQRIRHDVFQIAEFDVAVYPHQLARRFERDDFAVIGVGKRVARRRVLRG